MNEPRDMAMQELQPSDSWEAREKRIEEARKKKLDDSKEFAKKALPEYKCHKNVQAAKIHEVFIYTEMEGRSNEGTYAVLRVSVLGSDRDAYMAYIHVPREYIDRHNPKKGGYYVLYEDGYESYSPAKPFEDGYTMVK